MRAAIHLLPHTLQHHGQGYVYIHLSNTPHTTSSSHYDISPKRTAYIAVYIWSFQRRQFTPTGEQLRLWGPCASLYPRQSVATSRVKWGLTLKSNSVLLSQATHVMVTLKRSVTISCLFQSNYFYSRLRIYNCSICSTPYCDIYTSKAPTVRPTAAAAHRKPESTVSNMCPPRPHLFCSSSSRMPQSVYSSPCSCNKIKFWEFWRPSDPSPEEFTP